MSILFFYKFLNNDLFDDPIQFIIKESDEIAQIVKTGKKTVSKFYIIYNIENLFI